MLYMKQDIISQGSKEIIWMEEDKLGYSRKATSSNQDILRDSKHCT